VTPPLLVTERLRLRELRPDDRDGVFELFGDPQVTRFWSFPAWTDIAQADAFLAGDDDPGKLAWAVADRASDELVGTTTILDLRHDQGRAEIGFSLRRAYWKRGLAREAVTGALDYGFGMLGLRRFEADVDPRNAASLALLGDLGFVREGLLRARWFVNGEACDSVILGLLADDWRALRST
jgi:RimJ/RimL family protein N-acetyltransferase